MFRGRYKCIVPLTVLSMCTIIPVLLKWFSWEHHPLSNILSGRNMTACHTDFGLTRVFCGIDHRCGLQVSAPWWALPAPYKVTSSRPLVWMPLITQSERDFMRALSPLMVQSSPLTFTCFSQQTADFSLSTDVTDVTDVLLQAAHRWWSSLWSSTHTCLTAC